MKTISVTFSDVEIEFYTAKEIADATATAVLEDMTCLSWFDREKNQFIGQTP